MVAVQNKRITIVIHIFILSHQNPPIFRLSSEILRFFMSCYFIIFSSFPSHFCSFYSFLSLSDFSLFLVIICVKKCKIWLLMQCLQACHELLATLTLCHFNYFWLILTEIDFSDFQRFWVIKCVEKHNMKSFECHYESNVVDFAVVAILAQFCFDIINKIDWRLGGMAVSAYH